VVSLDLKNMDTEEKETESILGNLLQLVPADGSDLIKSNGATCQGQLNYRLVYGLSALPCTAEFKVPNDFKDPVIEIAVLGEKYESDSALLGLSDKPYWHNEAPDAVVQLKSTIRTEKAK
jgi:hypothetical protein